MRLQKYLALSSVASRRGAEAMIAAGRVSVNGQVVTVMGVEVNEGDIVAVDGAAVSPDAAFVYILLYKPRSVVSTVHDPQGRRTVLSFLPKMPVRLYPVGRLDYDTEGALLLTNDGELAHRMTHPSYEVEKVYRVRLSGYLTDEQVSRLRQGIELDDGLTAPAQVEMLSRAANESLLTLTLHEGRNRQVKRMVEAVGHRVVALERLQVGLIGLEGLQPGQWRYLTAQEVEHLRRLCALE